MRKIWLVENCNAANKTFVALLIRFLMKHYRAEIKKLEKIEKNTWYSTASLSGHYGVKVRTKI
ncbi:MAG: hypothetical protein ACTS84_02610 [Arsenophonus sp. NC-LC2-MAG3]